MPNGHPLSESRPLLEILRIERCAVAAPVAGGAAEIAQPAPKEVNLLFADTVAIVQSLHIVIEVQSAAFQQACPMALPQQFHRQGYAGRPSPTIHTSVSMTVSSGTLRRSMNI